MEEKLSGAGNPLIDAEKNTENDQSQQRSYSGRLFQTDGPLAAKL